MGKTSGSILVLAGVALAAYTLSFEPRTAATIAAPRAAPAFEAARKDVEKAEGETKPAYLLPPPALPLPAAPARTSTKTAAAPAPASPSGGSNGPPAVSLDEAPARVPAGKYKPADSPKLDSAALTRELQRQLKRVGCYGGAVSGVWSTSTRRAMKAFTDRVNATLPVDEPDQVLLAMVQNHRDAICSSSCPQGEGKAADGRCVPEALVARTGKEPPHAKSAAPATGGNDGGASRKAATLPAAAPPRPADEPNGRMSLAGPRPEPSAESRDRPNAAHTRRHRPTRRVRRARPPRYAETRHRRPYRDPRASMVPPGFPAWAIPAFSP